LSEERFKKIEDAQESTSKELYKINLTLMRIETTLLGKINGYDKHVDDGDRFRGQIFFWLITSICGGFIIAGGFGIWVGSLSRQVDTNTGRLTVIESLLYDHPRHPAPSDVVK
jgi:hypothetical protein